MVLVMGCSADGQNIKPFIPPRRFEAAEAWQQEYSNHNITTYDPARFRKVIVKGDGVAPHDHKKVEHMRRAELSDRLRTGVSKWIQ